MYFYVHTCILHTTTCPLHDTRLHVPPLLLLLLQLRVDSTSTSTSTSTTFLFISCYLKAVRLLFSIRCLFPHNLICAIISAKLNSPSSIWTVGPTVDACFFLMASSCHHISKAELTFFNLDSRANSRRMFFLMASSWAIISAKLNSPPNLDSRANSRCFFLMASFGPSYLQS